jgi:hypothetical protein
MVDLATPAPGVFTSAPASPNAILTEVKSATPSESKPALGDDFTAVPCSSAGCTADRPNGHRVDLQKVTTLIPPPSKGTSPCQSPSPLPLLCRPPRPPPPPHLGNHWESSYQGAARMAILTSFPSLTSLGLMEIILSYGSNKPSITSSSIEWSLLCGFRLPLCISMAQ